MHVCMWREQPQDLSLGTLSLFNIFKNYIILSVLMFCLHMCLCLICVSGGCSNQKMAFDPNSWELPCECWDLKLGPLKKQPMLLRTESSLQPMSTSFYVYVQF